jgi:hypothetical protein
MCAGEKCSFAFLDLLEIVSWYITRAHFHCSLRFAHRPPTSAAAALARSPISADFCHFSNGNVCV